MVLHWESGGIALEEREICTGRAEVGGKATAGKAVEQGCCTAHGTVQCTKYWACAVNGTEIYASNFVTFCHIQKYFFEEQRLLFRENTIF